VQQPTRDSLEALLRPSTLKILFPIGVIVFGAGGSVALWGNYHPSEARAREIASEVVNENDHGTVKPLPNPLLPPQQGYAAELRRQQATIESLAQKVESAETAAKTLRAFIVDQYRWRVRWQASDAEPDWRKRAHAGQVAEDRFDDYLSKGYEPDAAARRVLETNPYR
jgi:hypothetical protein